MVAIDATVLAYAVNRHAPEHPRAARALEELANGELPWALPWPAVHDFLGFATHPHAVVRPLGADDAWAFVERVLSSPSVRPLGPTDRHPIVLAEVLSRLSGPPAGLAGLQLAVTLREHGVRELLSSDRGMRRYGFLSVRDPLHGELWTPREAPVRRYRVLPKPPAGA